MKETEEEVVQKRDNDEIDLSPLFRRMDNALNKAVNTTGRAYKTIRLRFYIILLFLVFGIGAGVLYFMMKKPVYKSSITLSSQILPLDFIKDIVDNLDVLAKERSNTMLAQRLNINDAAVGNIVSFNYVNVYGAPDSLLRGQPFKIEVFVYDNAVLDELQPALVNYLENNEYANERKEKGILKLEMLKRKLDFELQELDSLKRIVSESIIPRGTGTGLIYGEPLDPVNIYKESVSLYEKKLVVENELSFMDHIHVISEFLPTLHPDSPDFIKSITFGGAAGFIAGIFLVLLIPVRRI